MQLTCESPETGVAEVWLALFFLAYLVVDLVVHSYTFARNLYRSKHEQFCGVHGEYDRVCTACR